MTISKGDIKLFKSKVMDDVPEGGGPPTAVEIQSGVSNEMYQDISETDRAAGNVALVKAFVGVQTTNDDNYLGANVIIGRPPTDPNVSATIFYTGDFFDERDSAKSRIESYLTQGTEWGGYLFENHIAGQRALQIFQRPGSALPDIGRTLVLIKAEGMPDEVKQYVRVTRRTAETKKFYDEATKTDFDAQVVTAEISDPLRHDFPGTPSRRDFSRADAASHLRDTLVADAATYCGVSPLKLPVSLGALGCRVESVYSQLVPSAQTEVPLVDYSAAGQSTTLTTSSTGTVSYTTAQEFSATTALSLGVAITPGTLVISASDVALTDSGGQLVSGSTPVGAVDYARGVITLAGLSGSYSGDKTIAFKPAAAPLRIPNTAAKAVTQETRAYNYTLTLVPTPAPGSVVVSYMAGGNWIDLVDDGAGRLSGLDSSFGAGTVNYATGTVLVTTGALPDVGSAVLFGWSCPVNFINRAAITPPKAGVRMTVANPAIRPGTLAITWNDGAARTATDNGAGGITGDATGTVVYETGVIDLAPTNLPAPNQQYTVGYTQDSPVDVKSEDITDPPRNPDGSVTLELEDIAAGGVQPGSLKLTWPVGLASGVSPEYVSDPVYGGASVFYTAPTTVTAQDNGTGKLILKGTGAEVGTVAYASGSITLHPDTATIVQGLKKYYWNEPALLSASSS